MRSCESVSGVSALGTDVLQSAFVAVTRSQSQLMQWPSECRYPTAAASMCQWSIHHSSSRTTIPTYFFQ